MSDLSPRQQSILNRIVETHIETALPVGSRFITDLYTELYRSSYSPATVRAEMGVLEDRGYLTHPHTSAGRLPTDRGYRYYVDYSLKEESPAQQVVQQISRELSEAAEEEQDFAEQASRLLSQLSEEVSLIVISGERRRLFVEGSSRMLEKPEFQDIQRARPVFKALEEKSTLAEWLLNRTSQSDVSITIGEENDSQAFQDCSVISAPYGVRGKRMGTVAIMGPRRMRYAKAVPLVALMGRMIQNILNDLEES